MKGDTRKAIDYRDPHTISQAHLLEQHARNFRSRSSDARATLESAGALFRASSRPSDMPTAGSRMRGIAMLERARSGGGIPTRLTP